jgi:hypothetical protein
LLLAAVCVVSLKAKELGSFDQQRFFAYFCFTQQQPWHHTWLKQSLTTMADMWGLHKSKGAQII